MSLSDTNPDGKIHRPLKTIKREKKSKEREDGCTGTDTYYVDTPIICDLSTTYMFIARFILFHISSVDSSPEFIEALMIYIAQMLV